MKHIFLTLALLFTVGSYRSAIGMAPTLKPYVCEETNTSFLFGDPKDRTDTAKKQCNKHCEELCTWKMGPDHTRKGIKTCTSQCTPKKLKDLAQYPLDPSQRELGKQ